MIYKLVLCECSIKIQVILYSCFPDEMLSWFIFLSTNTDYYFPFVCDIIKEYDFNFNDIKVLKPNFNCKCCCLGYFFISQLLVMSGSIIHIPEV